MAKNYAPPVGRSEFAEELDQERRSAVLRRKIKPMPHLEKRDDKPYKKYKLKEDLPCPDDMVRVKGKCVESSEEGDTY